MCQIILFGTRIKPTVNWLSILYGKKTVANLNLNTIIINYSSNYFFWRTPVSFIKLMLPSFCKRNKPLAYTHMCAQKPLIILTFIKAQASMNFTCCNIHYYRDRVMTFSSCLPNEIKQFPCVCILCFCMCVCVCVLCCVIHICVCCVVLFTFVCMLKMYKGQF